MKQWTFSPEEEPFAIEVLEKFTNERGFVLYDKLRRENPVLFNKISNGRDHRQLQQSLSKIRIRLGKKLMGFGGATKKSYLSNQDNQEVRVKRKYTKRAKPDLIQAKPVVSIGIQERYEMNCCPNCGCNLKAAKVGLNMPL